MIHLKNIIPIIILLVEEWSVEDVVLWAADVAKFGIEDQAILRNKKVDGGALVEIFTLEQLKSVDVTGGPAIKLLAAIHKLRAAVLAEGNYY